jgi:hypothetical protein
MSPFWLLEFLGGSWISGKFVHPVLSFVSSLAPVLPLQENKMN